MPAIYTPPLRDMQFVMHELLDVTTSLQQVPAYADIDADTIDQVLDEAGKFCAEVLLPLNLSGDQEGCRFDAATHEVTVPKGFKDAYRQYVDGGWPALSADPAFGGQGLPHLIEIAFSEMKYATNQAWTMYPSLAHGAYTALLAHGTDAQKKLYLPKITSGEWLGTMCLTESHCGTDLGMLRTKAEPQSDGTGDEKYALTGNKIFISAGEHDMAANIVHLVLARLPDAPAGSKGISLFVVPKYLPVGDDEHATVGERNPIFCGRDRTQDGHPRQRDLPAQPRRRDRLDGGPAEQGLGRDVRDDERRAPRRRRAGSRPDRDRVPERGGVCEGPHPGSLVVGPEVAGPAGRPDHRAPRRPQDAADRACVRRRRSCVRDPGSRCRATCCITPTRQSRRTPTT